MAAVDEVIALPKGGGSLHGLGESYSADLHTGTGAASVPIGVPAGRNGFQPSLALTYGSGNGNGPFGIGWTLAVPAITRKTAKGVPRYDGTDTFILPGADDLVPVADSGGVTRYRPRTEGTFARIEHVQDGSDDRWEVRTKDGAVHVYGTRVLDAGGAGGIFAWLLRETRDSFGNRAEYSYSLDTPVDPVAREVAELRGHVWNRRRLDRIAYVDYEDAAGTDRFLVTVDFEYEDRPDPFSEHRAGFELRTATRCSRISVTGHADPAQPQPVRDYELAYLDGADLPANAASLLASIQVVGHGDAGAVERLPALMFGYTGFDPARRTFEPVRGDELPAASLASPNQALVDLTGDGLPDVLELGGAARWWRNVGAGLDTPRALESVPAGVELGQPGVELLDADGDGRADLLVQRDGGYYPLTARAGFDGRSLRRYAYAPSVDLEDPEVRLVDLDGDGLTDIVRSGEAFECFFNASSARNAWQRTRAARRRRLEDFPDVSFSDTRVRFADMTGDGLQDVLVIHDRSIDYWPNRGHGDFGPRLSMRRAADLPLGYDPERVLVGDVDGDGAADLVYVDDGSVTVWLNQAGNGWSAPVRIEGTPATGDIGSVRLADFRGHGIQGVLWSFETLGPTEPTLLFLDLAGGVKPYLLSEMDNQIGATTRIRYRPSTAYYLDDEREASTRWRTSLPFPVQVVARTETEDAISGATLVQEFSYRHGYWDGHEREFHGFGQVRRRDTELVAGAPDPARGPPVETRTWFHQGAVEDSEGDWAESDLSDEHWPQDRSWLEDRETRRLQLAALPRPARRDALRSLRGKVVRTEVYALDGSAIENRPYTVVEHAYGLTQVPDGASGARVFFPHSRATRTTRWERGDDPLTTLTFTEGYDALGRPRDEIAIALPRRSARRGTLDETGAIASVTRTSYAQPDTGVYIHDRVSHSARFSPAQRPAVPETDPADPDAVLADQAAAARSIRADLLARLGDWEPGEPEPAALSLLAHSVSRYDGAAFTGRPPGEVGPAGGLSRTETLCFTDTLLNRAYGSRRPAYLGGQAGLPAGAPAGFGAALGYTRRSATPGSYCEGWYAPARSQDLDDRGVVVGLEDPLGRRTRVELDRFELLPARTTDPAGLTRTAEYDYRAFLPRRVVDENGNATVLRYTALGQLERQWLEGRAGEGGDAQEPEVRYSYDFGAYAATRDGPNPQPIHFHLTRRIEHAAAGGSDDVVESRTYVDGFGRAVQTRAQADPLAFGGVHGEDVGLPLGATQAPQAAAGSVRADRVIVSAWQRYDNKGRVAESYEAFFGRGWAYQPAAEAQQGQRTRFFFDPVGRMHRTRYPDGSEQRIQFGSIADVSDPAAVEPSPWESYVYDANDLDGTPGVTAASPTTTAAPAAHRFTPASRHFDALGRVVAEVERNGPLPADVFLVRRLHDVEGKLEAVVDQLGREAFRYVYDLHGHVLRTASIDAGLRTAVYDARGNAVEERASNGTAVIRELDALNRLSRVWARDGAQQPLTLREWIEYGDGGDPAQAPATRTANRSRNRLGRPWRHWDEAGRVEFVRYDFEGNLTEKLRRVVSDAAIAQGWTAAWSAAGAAGALAAGGFTTTRTHDALGRVTEILYPTEARPRAPGQPARRARLVAEYGPADSITALTLDGNPVVSRIAYDARGQRVLVALANGLMTRVAYDPLTRRPGRLRTERYTRAAGSNTFNGQGGVLRDETYRYDPAGNPTTIDVRTPNCGVAGSPEGRNRLLRRFEYDPLYRLTSATGRACSASGARPLTDTAVCGSYAGPYVAGAPVPSQANAPDLTHVYTERYEHDPVGNLLSLAYTGAGANWTRRYGLGGTDPADWRNAPTNRATSIRIGSVRHDCAYDASGNLRLQNTDRTHGWDHADRMVSYRVQAGAAASVTARYLYGADGRRVKQWVRRGAGAAQVESTVYIDGIFELGEWRDGGAARRGNRLHTLISGERVALFHLGDRHADDAGPPVQYHLHDQVGSSAVVVSGDGAWVSREEYSPYGETVFGGFARKRYRFGGKERDPASGLCDHGLRLFAPWLARWVSCDPAALRAGGGGGPPPDARERTAGKPGCLYQFAAASPIRFGDPTGLQEQEDPGVTEAKEARGYLQQGTAEGMAEIAPVAEFVVSFHPGIAASEAYKGETSITKEKLSWWQRLLNVPGVPDMGAATLGTVVTKGTLFKRVSKFTDEDIAEHIDEVSDVARTGTNWTRTVDKLPEAPGAWSRLMKKFGRWTPQEHVDELARNLDESDVAAGITFRDRSIWQPHHVVAVNDPRAERARKVLDKFKIDVDSASNGLWLPNSKFDVPEDPATHHRYIHTDVYFEEINIRLEKAATEGAERVHLELAIIKDEISKNKFPF